MAIENLSLKGRIIKAMNKLGFVTEGEFAMGAQLAEAIANAVVDEIQQNAVVTVTNGSSAGEYKVS